MSIHVCPRCQQRYVRQEFSGDYVHECNSGNPTLDNEDIVVVGDWEDYAGSAIVQASHLQVAGTQNKLFGTRAWLEGGKDSEKTLRGANKSTHRTRQHLHYNKHCDGGIANE